MGGWGTGSSPHSMSCHSLFLDIWVRLVRNTQLQADLKERTAPLAPPSGPASLDREGRDFTLAIHLSAVGEGTQKRRGGRKGREKTEKMETEKETQR